jgi:hypothetical protein
MKTRLFAIALVAVMIGLGACGSKKPDKPEPLSGTKDITAFVVNGVSYTISGTSISHHYPKTAENTWTSLPSWPAAAQITHTGKSISPTTPQNFEDAAGVVYTVTAEDGTTKTYTVKATRQAEL